jgi:coatomer protein complex subunit alpha (xenin)
MCSRHQDERTRFNLALECGNIEVALASAQEIDEKDTWHRLGVEALRQGNHQIVEFAYQKTKNFERLSFLYLITGNKEKLAKMLKISEMRSDVMGQFHNALYLGDVRERVKILETSGHYPLAYLTAKTHGLEEDAARLEESLTESGVAVPAVDGHGELFTPPTPILRDDNWPLLTVSKGFFEGVLSGEVGGEYAAGYGMGEEDGGGAGWGDDLDIDLGGGVGAEEEEEDPLAAAGLAPEDREEGEEGDEDAGWEMEDLELPPDMDTGPLSPGGGDGFSETFIAPTAGVPASRRWTQKSAVPGEHAAAGDFDSAMKLLNRQLGIVHFAPLRQYFIDAALATHVPLTGVAGAPALSFPLGRGWTAEDPPGSTPPPALVSSLPLLEEKLKTAYKTTTEGKFGEALKLFVSIIHSITVLLVESRREVDEVRELLGIAREYATALRIEIKRKEFKDDMNRQAELAAYFTHSNLQPIHLSLSLRSAMSLFFKLKNFNTAAGFCRRLLELNPPIKVAQQAKQVRRPQIEPSNPEP